MNAVNQLEDFSNDLFLEIFEYFHALDLFMAFSLLNHRITCILSSTRLHVVISKLHCQYEMKFLSSHLIHRANQVVSISLEDQLRDYTSVISFFFTEHTFINLQSCKFYRIDQSSNLNNAIQKLKNLTKLVSFRVFQPQNIPLSPTSKQDISKTILMHVSPTLRSINLLYHYDYPNLVANIARNLTLTSLQMILHTSNGTLSIYSFLPILRHYRALRVLRIIISNKTNSNTQQAMPPILPATYESNPPISPSIRTFDLSIRTSCNFHSLDFILHCMPNLRRFIVTIIYSSAVPFRWRTIFDGYRWEQILTRNTPYLDVFDILLMVNNDDSVLLADTTLKSFDYFKNKYDDWHVAIYRLPMPRHTQKQRMCLRGLQCSKKVRYINLSQIQTILGKQHSLFTTSADPQHHLFCSYANNLRIYVPVNRIVYDTQSFSQLFKNIDYLTIQFDASTLTFWEDMCDLFHMCVRKNESDLDERAEKVASLVDLTSITKLEIQPTDNLSHLHFIKKILLASSRLIHLKIGGLVIFSSILQSDAALIPVFKRLESLHLFGDFSWFSWGNISKLIECFPSLIHLEFKVHSPDIHKSLFDNLLDGLPRLNHLKIHFRKSKLLINGTCLIHYVTQRRRQAFPDHLINENQVYATVDGKNIDIYLSGCSICTQMQSCF